MSFVHSKQWAGTTVTAYRSRTASSSAVVTSAQFLEVEVSCLCAPASQQGGGV